MMQKNTENLISLKKASKMSGYSPDYISYLIRNKKIHGKKVGRDWLTTEEEIRKYTSTKKFFSFKSVLFSYINTKLITVAFIFSFILLAIAAIYYLKNETNSIKAAGDFKEREDFQNELSNIESFTKNEIEITRYMIDSPGDIKASVMPESSLEKDNPSFLNKTFNFLNNIF